MLNGRGASASAARKPRTKESEKAHEIYVERTYLITSAMYRALKAWQGNRCYACPRTGKARRLSLDHNHRTGEVRMLLCNTCNNIVGHFKDNPEALIRLGLALINPPSRRAWSDPDLPLPGWWDDEYDPRDVQCCAEM